MRRFWQYLILTAALLLWVALTGGISLFIESRWFDSLGFWSVFRTSVSARFTFFLAGFLISLSVLSLNNWLSFRSPGGTYWFKPEFAELAGKSARGLFLLVSVGLSFITGIVLQTKWMMMLQYLHQVPAGRVDSIFGFDLSFYFFSLPVYELAVNYAMAVLLISLVMSAVNYFLHGHLGFEDRFRLTGYARRHLTILISAVFFLLGLRFWLQRFSIMYSRDGVVFGPGYTDIHAWIPCFWLLTLLALVTGFLFLISLTAKTLKLATATGLGFVVCYLGLNIYPAVLQTFIVAPNEIQKEQPYIRNHIDATLEAYNLDKIEVHDFAHDSRLTESDLRKNDTTLRNIRLWDWRPLKDAYGQLQSIRLYYEFEDADVGRYVINDQYRQVMLSARELDFSKISESAQNWINQHFQYTHGQGLCMSPVNEVTSEGLPEFFIKDIPPRSSIDLGVSRPEIYFGEKTDYPVFVRTELEEFDYPLGDQNATTTYQAERGIPIDSFLMRLMFSWELGIYQILFTGNFNEDSRVLLHRRIQDRVPRLAPFLSYDEDPYLVVDGGRLLWVIDAYTTTDRYPYSEPFPDRQTAHFNYIRNSVKVVVDAYLGDVTFYVVDPADPIIRTYTSIFPELFRSLDDMPASLRNHIRYPVDLFDVQRHVYGRYHMTDPTVFYNQEDVWEVPTEIYRGNEQVMESYYVIMSLPGSPQEEFILMIPFTPRNKNNMVAWLAARSDGENYGKLVLYQFPKQELTYGPMQIEARIDQNPEISQLITLWSQKGSRVIRGNLLVIPIEESLLYVEPLYLQAEKSEIPELTRIIVVYEGQVTLSETLEGALTKAILGVDPGVVPELMPDLTSSGPAIAAPGSESLERLIQEALDHYRQSQRLLREGNWSGYGEEQKKLAEVLERLSQLNSVSNQ
ncbi:MAG: UPF0182 family protein [Acidobacteriota bacterium]|nr:MAG: UPF0182 family protein [Acidobacteriota bacterium]